MAAIQVMLLMRDPALAWLYREELEDAGFGVRVSCDLPGAMGALKAQPADVLVADPASQSSALESWLKSLRSVHGGGVVVLGGARPVASAGKHCFVDKSSDMRPLINSVRQQALSRLWSRAASGTC